METAGEIVHHEVQVLLLLVQGVELFNYGDNIRMRKLGNDFLLPVPVLFLLQGDF